MDNKNEVKDSTGMSSSEYFRERLEAYKEAFGNKDEEKSSEDNQDK